MTEPEPHSGVYVDGAWRAGSDGRTFEVRNPADDSVLATLADASAPDASDALAAAAAAQSSWGATPVGTRAGLLRELHNAVLERAEEFADLITAESGKTLADARGEVGYGAQFLAWFADQASQLPHGEHYTDPAGAVRILTQYRPVGPCLLITPWNFPLAMITRKLAPALAAGCTSVVKPAAQTPLTAVRLVELLHELGLPAGVVNLLSTTRAVEVSEAVFASPALRKVSFTGSTGVGSALLRAGAERVVNSSMELGGDAPLIVFDDAEPDHLDQVLVAKLRNSGQSCIAANRILVQDASADAFVEALAERFHALRVGAGRAEGTDVGPLIDDAAVRKVSRLVDEAVAAGARIAAQAPLPEGPGSYYPPTLLVDVPGECAIAREEIFGPVACVSRFKDEADAIRTANATQAGLASYVFTQDLSKALRVGTALDFGIVGVNRGFVSTAAAPFGGIKTSGLGREGGLHGLDEYLECQYLSLPVNSPT
ncbi:NAD-dependent succinate-semialdehyde dehydrogenase [Nocardia alni]|uniref:NAD-dependent succinate-semialdehyde dehydrogenase n=1 Tax=Nocardia alni TaxID=2815723 RepID=UPI001C23C05D|nr:NAD-dependent succinate-semialdehyde dehydrogenase [Nocardia alni]